MNLRDLVGRMAIRTDKVREVMPWEMERAFRLDFMVPVPTFDREKYMDEPVRILAVEGSQVVIEKDGKRKLLERRYIDERWTDYERLLHPEEEEKEKAEKLMKEFEAQKKLSIVQKSPYRFVLNWFLNTFSELKEDEDKKGEAKATAAEEAAPASEPAADLKFAANL